uniref:Uncharacterized protein n=1 Tax=Ditylenchus dipsaci TaxID=166011 RepID=A0A915D8C4_9BILA
MHSPMLKTSANQPVELRQGAEALEDLNSIDFTQLVQPNSAIITTEDYLPQTSSTMTYASMDMRGGNGPTNQEIGIHIDSTKEMMQTTQFQQYLQAGQRFGHREQLGWQNIGMQQQHTSSYMMAGVSHVAAGQINSSTPDSGIESGSPPSVSSYTPPMVSPYTTQVTSCDSGQYPLSIPNMSASSVNTVKSSNADESDDFSDMPTLLPAMTQQQNTQEDTINDYINDLTPPAMEEGNISPPLTNQETELNTKKVDTETASTSGDISSLLFAVTPSMDLSELAEKLYSSITPEQLRQLTSLIQSKAALVTETPPPAPVPPTKAILHANHLKKKSPNPAANSGM